MILVPFFSEDNVLSDEIKICYIFEISNIKVTKIERSAFWVTRHVHNDLGTAKLPFYNRYCYNIIIIRAPYNYNKVLL